MKGREGGRERERQVSGREVGLAVGWMGWVRGRDSTADKEVRETANLISIALGTISTADQVVSTCQPMGWPSGE